MKFTLEISCDNAAFGESPEQMVQEIADILGSLSRKMESDPHYSPYGQIGLRDSNGNKVGTAKFTKN